MGNPRVLAIGCVVVLILLETLITCVQAELDDEHGAAECQDTSNEGANSEGEPQCKTRENS